MAWLESHTTLRDHPKRKRLSRLLGVSAYEAIGLLHVLWWWALDFAPEGDLGALSDEDVADAIDFDGDAHALMAALVRSGFVDGDRRIHDWDEYAEKWIARRVANRERMRAARASRNGTVSEDAFAHVDTTSGARVAQNVESVGLPDQPTGPTGPDRTGPDQPDLPTNQPDTPQTPRKRGANRRRSPIPADPRDYVGEYAGLINH